MCGNELRSLDFHAVNRPVVSTRRCAAPIVAVLALTSADFFRVVLQRQQSRFGCSCRLQRFPRHGIDVVSPSNKRHKPSRAVSKANLEFVLAAVTLLPQLQRFFLPRRINLQHSVNLMPRTPSRRRRRIRLRLPTRSLARKPRRNGLFRSLRRNSRPCVHRRRRIIGANRNRRHSRNPQYRVQKRPILRAQPPYF
jgi:hypothetical protein